MSIRLAAMDEKARAARIHDVSRSGRIPRSDTQLTTEGAEEARKPVQTPQTRLFEPAPAVIRGQTGLELG